MQLYLYFAPRRRRGVVSQNSEWCIFGAFLDAFRSVLKNNYSLHWIALKTWTQYVFKFTNEFRLQISKNSVDFPQMWPYTYQMLPLSVTWTFQPPQIRNPCCCCWRILIISTEDSTLLPYTDAHGLSVLNFQLLCVDNWWPSAKKFLKTFNGPVYVFKVEIIPLYVIALLN